MTRLFTVLALSLLVFACSNDPNRVRVATDPHDPPLSFLDDHDQRQGFEIDLMEAIARHNGWTLAWSSVPQTGLFGGVDWDGILAGLRGNHYELVISHEVATADLRLTWAVSQPYLWSGPVLLVDNDRPASDVTALSDKPVGTVAQAELDQVLLRARVSDDTQRKYPSLEGALLDLTEGRLAGVIAPLDAAAAYREEQERFALSVHAAQRLTDDFPYAVFARSGDDARIQAVNAALNALEADGTLAGLRQKWFLDVGPGTAR